MGTKTERTPRDMKLDQGDYFLIIYMLNKVESRSPMTTTSLRLLKTKVQAILGEYKEGKR